MKLIALVLLFFGKLATCQYLKSEYKSSATYYDRYLLDSPYNLCRAPLMRQSVVSSLDFISRTFPSKFQLKFTWFPFPVIALVAWYFLKFVKLLQVNATSESSQRSALKAVLWGGSAWTAENSDFDQHLTVDLGTIKNITGIATQGRAHVDEYVMEFRIQYGSNGKDFIGKGPFLYYVRT